MNFNDFLKQASAKSFWSKNSIYFNGKQYPHLFCSQLFFTLKKKNIFSEFPTRLLLDSPEGVASLHQSFLGKQLIYWLGDVSDSIYDKKKKKALSVDLFSYSGPHTLVFFVNGEVSLSRRGIAVGVEIPDQIHRELFEKVLFFFGKNTHKTKKELIDVIFEQSPTIPLESACRLIDYIDVVSVKSKETFRQYLMQLVKPTTSLFTLSEHFFAKREKEFFELWKTMQDTYSPLFWIIFWSEQIWRAHFVITFLNDNNITQARSMSRRLPFSFIKTLWKKYSLLELAAAHNFLYKADYAAKTGSTFCTLDLFFANHFNSTQVF